MKTINLNEIEDIVELPRYVMPKYDGINVRRIKGKYYTRDGKNITSRLQRYHRFGLWEQGIENACNYDLSFELCYGNTATDVAQVWSKDGIDPFSDIFCHIFTINNKDWSIRKYQELAIKLEITPIRDIIALVELHKLPRCPTAFCQQLLSIWNNIYQPIEGLIFKQYLNSENYKWKPYLTVDLKVFRINEGTNRNKKRLGSISLLDGNGVVRGNCGTGFNDDQRISYWESKSSLQNQIVEIQYDRLSEDGILIFPRFVRVREDKQEADKL